MTYDWRYTPPKEFSKILLHSDGEYLTGLHFESSKDSAKYAQNSETKELPIFTETSLWLDIYFKGKEPDFTPKYKIKELTSFRKEVIDIMLQIPFGGTITYGDIAKKLAHRKGLAKMSAQAVGGAVGWNPICLIIPCHRVIGTKGKLTGYGGGLRNKQSLLELESQALPF